MRIYVPRRLYGKFSRRVDPPASNPIKDAFNYFGFMSPVNVLEPSRLSAYRSAFHRTVASYGPDGIPPRHTMKSHLLYPWVHDLVHTPKVIDIVTSIIGDEVLLLDTSLQVKDAWGSSTSTITATSSTKTALETPWHQDEVQWDVRLSEQGVCVWISLFESNESNGAMQVISMSHNRGVLPHVDSSLHASILSPRGSRLTSFTPASHDDEDEVGEGEGDGGKKGDTVGAEGQVVVALSAGDMSLHHPRLIHRSLPNKSRDRRVGIAARFIPMRARPHSRKDFATAIRGTYDKRDEFTLEQKPLVELGKAEISNHALVVDRLLEVRKYKSFFVQEANFADKA